ncbi:hypothetical protein [Magnetospira sp. QH-2]|uniref:hypothetical protein n=1 Tax=Magnetospira sp. (strain QH-2) TaxID=1288970 RepID=UPI0003E819B0|nr:hypothetical protein [Magnetospira sp. QH-2]CCQ73810.1 Conserved protein of unknown function [Magnetospira sp. QH-2]
MTDQTASTESLDAPSADGGDSKPTAPQRRWLTRGTKEPGGKLPLFDEHGQKVSERTIRSCIHHGWAEPWFANPLKPDWLVCKITAAGRAVVNKS